MYRDIREVRWQTDYLKLTNCLTITADESLDRILVRAQYILPKDKRCPTCGGSAKAHQKKWRKFLDAPRDGRPVEITLLVFRGKCNNGDCALTTFNFHDERELSDGMTFRCRRYIEDRCFKETFASLSRTTGISESKIRRIASSLVKYLDENFRIDTPEYLAIDEVHLRSGKDYHLPAKSDGPYPRRKAYRTVISDGETSQVIDLLPDRKRSTVAHFLRNLPGGARVKAVTIDLSDVFRSAVKDAFGEEVTIVADRWHVVKRINQVIDNERMAISEVSGEWTSSKRSEADSLRHALRSRGKKMSAKNPGKYFRIEGVLENNLDLKRVYLAKEALLDVYDQETMEDARSCYQTWEAELGEFERAKFANVRKTFRNWGDEIFAYWSQGSLRNLPDKILTIDGEDWVAGTEFRDAKRRVKKGWVGPTNSRAEARNREIRQINRAGRSYSYRFIRARSIFSTFVVSDHFGICDGCLKIFKRDPRHPRYQIFRMDQRSWGNAKYLMAPACEDCDERSIGVTRSDDKPVPQFVNRCGLGDVWADHEPSIADIITKEEQKARVVAVSAGFHKRIKGTDKIIESSSEKQPSLGLPLPNEKSGSEE